MIIAILIGRQGSKGFPGKNTYCVLGRPIMEYALLSVKYSSLVDRTFVSTDCKDIKAVASKYNVDFIERPEYLNSDSALGEDVFHFCYSQIKNVFHNIEFILLLFCNAPCFLFSQIKEGIVFLRENSEYDSAVTVSKYNMYSPVRARKIIDNTLYPFIPFSKLQEEPTISCDRDCQGNVYFADCCLSIVRPECLTNMEEGILPQKWMGKKIYPIVQEGGLDIDYKWQLPQLTYYIKNIWYKNEESVL